MGFEDGGDLGLAANRSQVFLLELSLIDKGARSRGNWRHVPGLESFGFGLNHQGLGLPLLLHHLLGWLAHLVDEEILTRLVDE